MFLGTYTHSLDSKSRLTIPAKYREFVVPGLVVTRHPQGNCLMAMPLAQWEKVAGRVSDLAGSVAVQRVGHGGSQHGGEVLGAVDREVVAVAEPPRIEPERGAPPAGHRRPARRPTNHPPQTVRAPVPRRPVQTTAGWRGRLSWREAVKHGIKPVHILRTQ